MCRRAFVRTGFAPVLLLGLARCASIGPAVIPRDRTDYLSSIADSWKEQNLLNIVRIRYGDAPSFLDVSSIISSYAIGGQISAGGAFNSNLTSVAPWSTATVGAGVAYQDRPTISYTPLAGDKFTRSLLRPIPPTGIFQLIQAGFAADAVLQITVKSLNGIRNKSASGGGVQAANPVFYQLLEALRRLQLSGAVSMRTEKRAGQDVGILVMTGNRTPEVNKNLKFVTDTLHIRLERNGETRIVFGAVQRDDRELAVQSRSMAEILVEIASGVQVPPKDVANGSTVPSARVASATNPWDRPLVRILSGPTAPSHAFCAVRYHNTWFWVDDHDFASKRVFTTLMILFSLAESGTTPQVPTLTIPVN